MKKLLYTLLIIEIILAVVAFFVLLYTSVFAAVFLSALNLLTLVPIIAIIHNINDIDELEYTMSKLRYKVKVLEDIVNKDAPEKEKPTEKEAPYSMGNWTCIKCGTINKMGTNECENCKAQYSIDCPTTDPSKKKKVSRFVKYK